MSWKLSTPNIARIVRALACTAVFMSVFVGAARLPATADSRPPTHVGAVVMRRARQFAAICDNQFKCALSTPLAAAIGASNTIIDITAGSPYTATFTFSPTFEQVSPGEDLSNLQVEINLSATFARQRYVGGRYEIEVPDMPVQNTQASYAVQIGFSVRGAATVTYQLQSSAQLRVRPPATATPLPPTKTPTPIAPTVTPIATATANPAATNTPVPPNWHGRLFMPVLWQDSCASEAQDWCEPNGSIDSAFGKLSIGSVINAQLRAVFDINDLYRIEIPDTTPVTITVSALAPAPGTDIDLELYSAARVRVCASTFTGVNTEVVRIGVTPCSEGGAFRTTRLGPGVYFIRAVLSAPSADNKAVPYSLSILR
jgi:hypothetical protein